MKTHSERKHSKFSASGSERWFACPGSVSLSEGIPSKESVWSKEGTKAHEVLESIMMAAIEVGATRVSHARFDRSVPYDMQRFALHAANYILKIHKDSPGSSLMVETRIHLPFIHPEMFGTFDGAVVDHFGTLHVFDYKYGQGYAVSPVQNLQMIFYGLGLADMFQWNFNTVRLWIIQPRISGYKSPVYWELGILELKDYVTKFRIAVERVQNNPRLYIEGKHCHWCPAKSICPLKQEAKLEKAKLAFQAQPLKTQ